MAGLATLSDDKNIPTSVISATMLSLGQLMEQNPIAFYELVSWCLDRNHELFGNTAEILYGKGLLHDVVRDVVAVAVTGDDLDMALADWPVAR